MPFYEYECQSCKFYTEVLQKISDAPLVKCPSCGKNKLKKLVSAPVFRLKGGGWYETDFKSDKENKRNLAVEKDADSSSSAAESKVADTKADASAPAATPAESKGTESKAAEPAPSASKSAAKSAPSASRGRVAPAKARPATKAKSKPKAALARGKKRR
jgi:putative FmdB family regulatory protein